MEQVGTVDHFPKNERTFFPPNLENKNENAANVGDGLNKRRAAFSAEERLKGLNSKKRKHDRESSPSSSTADNEILANENDSQCVCGIGWAGDQSFMIQCDSCSNWYHGKCVGVKSYQVPRFWSCTLCGNKTSNEEDELVDIEGNSNSDSEDEVTSFSEVTELIPSTDDYNSKPSRRVSWNQYAIAAYKILQREKRPMSYKELTDMAIKERLIVTSSSTPTCSMSSALSTHANKGIRFKRISSGVYSLLEWDNNPDISVKILEYSHQRKRGRKPNSMKANKVMDETQKLVKENLSDSDGTNDSCFKSSNLTYQSKAEVGHVEETLQISVNIKHEERDKSHIEERSLPLIKRLNFRFQQ